MTETIGLNAHSGLVLDPALAQLEHDRAQTRISGPATVAVLPWWHQPGYIRRHANQIAFETDAAWQDYRQRKQLDRRGTEQ